MEQYLHIFFLHAYIIEFNIVKDKKISKVKSNSVFFPLFRLIHKNSGLYIKMLLHTYVFSDTLIAQNKPKKGEIPWKKSTSTKAHL